MKTGEKKPRKSKKAMFEEMTPPTLVPIVKTVQVPLPAPPLMARDAKEGDAPPAAPPAELGQDERVAELRARGVDVVFTPDDRPDAQAFAGQAEQLVTATLPRPVTPEDTLAFRQKVVSSLEVMLASKMLQRDYALMRLQREQRYYDRYRVEAEDIQRRIDRLKARMKQGQ